MVAVLAFSMAACGQNDSKDKAASGKTTESKNVERPEAVPEEDWEAMKKNQLSAQSFNICLMGSMCICKISGRTAWIL